MDFFLSDIPSEIRSDLIFDHLSERILFIRIGFPVGFLPTLRSDPIVFFFKKTKFFDWKSYRNLGWGQPSEVIGKYDNH